MAKSRGNPANAPKMERWLKKHGYMYEVFSTHHYRILGDVAIVDVWPSRMTVNVVQSEAIYPERYFRMSYDFNADELQRVLLGRRWNDHTTTS